MCGNEPLLQEERFFAEVSRVPDPSSSVCFAGEAAKVGKGGVGEGGNFVRLTGTSSARQFWLLVAWGGKAWTHTLRLPSTIRRILE